MHRPDLGIAAPGIALPQHHSGLGGVQRDLGKALRARPVLGNIHQPLAKALALRAGYNTGFRAPALQQTRAQLQIESELLDAAATVR